MPPGPRQGRSFLPILAETALHSDWQRVFGSHTFHEITNYYPTRFIRPPRHKYHRNVAWQLDFPFSGDLYGSLSWEGKRNRQPVFIGGRALKDYIRRLPEELYDLEDDRREVVNLATDPGHQNALLDLREAMGAWQRQTGDPWLYRDGISLRAAAHHGEAGLRLPERFDFDPGNPGNQYRIACLVGTGWQRDNRR